MGHLLQSLVAVFAHPESSLFGPLDGVQRVRIKEKVRAAIP